MLMRSKALVVAAVSAGMCAGAGVAAGDVVAFVPSHDNTLYQSATGGLSNGAGPNFFVGLTNGSQIRRGLVEFDLNSIPAGSVITSATLQLTCTQASSPIASAVSAHLLAASWGEGTSNAGLPGGSGAPATPGDATWLHRFFNTDFWATQGGDFAPTASATQSVTSSGVYTWASTASLVADVQSWVDNPATNFGWLMQGSEETLGGAKRFDSRETTTPDAAPKLIVEYTPVPAPEAATVVLAGVLCGCRRRRA